MTVNDLQQDLTHLKGEAHSLVKEELDNIGDNANRYQIARQLNEQLLSLRPLVDSAPKKQREGLDLLWRAAERDLIFLLFAADKAEISAQPEDIVSRFLQFSTEVFKLAKSLADHAVDPSTAQQQGMEMYRRLRNMAQLPGVEQPEVQQAIVDSRLEITWICSGGKGPTSLRLHHYIKGS